MSDRARGGAHIAAGLTRHDHVCWSYSDDAERSAVLAAFFHAGLRDGEKLLYFGHSGDATPATDALRAAGHDPDQLVRIGALVLGDVVEAYLPGDTFDAAARVEGFREVARRAVTEGYTGIRVAAENSVVLNVPEIRDAWFGYELEVEWLTAAEPIVGMCCFDRRQMDAEALAQLDAVHRVQLDPDGSAPRLGFQLHGRRDGSVALHGEIDAFVAETLEKLLQPAVATRDPFGLDASGLRFIDGAGLRTLERLARRREPDLSPVRLQNVPDLVRRMLTVCGDPEAFTLVEAAAPGTAWS